MRFTVYLTAFLLASISAITALPIDSEQQQEARDTQQLDSRHEMMTSNRITYYSGKQLNNPACGGPNPTSHSLIAAVKQGGAFSCGDRIHITHKGRSVIVKVVDFCPSCSPHDIDLTPGAFSKLAPTDQGIISGAKMYKM